MNIVKPCNPSGMSVTVDLITKEITLNIDKSHPILTRVDFVFVQNGEIGIHKGTPGFYEGFPFLGIDTRLLARIMVWPSCTRIYEQNIEEIYGK